MTTGSMRRASAAVVCGLMLAGVVTVAAGAESGSPVAPSISWSPCPDDSGRPDSLSRAGAECAVVMVPLDYRRPGGRRVGIAVSRIKATAKRHGVLFHNAGGPGMASRRMPLLIRERLTNRGAHFDLIGMDPRFVGESSPLDCGWPDATGWEGPGLNRADFRAHVARFRELAATCGDQRDVLPHIHSRNTARDMDFIREALGEPRISYFGWSYGSHLGGVYSTLFPDRVDRFVFDGVTNYRTISGSRSSEEPLNRALDAWADWTAARDGEYHLGTSRDAVLDVLEGLIQETGRPGGITVGRHALNQFWTPRLVALLVGDERRDAVLSAFVREFRKASLNEPHQLSAEVDHMLARITDPTVAASVVQQMGVLCGDVADRGIGGAWRRIEQSRERGPIAGPISQDILPCAYWPTRATEAPTIVRNKAKVLLVNATGDTQTAYSDALITHWDLPRSRLVTVNTRAHTSFGNLTNPCVDSIVNAYLDTGILPATNPTCAG